MKCSGKKRFHMRFKKFFAAVLSALCVGLSLNTAVYANSADSSDNSGNSSQETEQDEKNSDLSALLHGYSEDMMMEQYSFRDGATFYCSAELSEEENNLSMLALVTNDEDVSIKVCCNGELLPEKKEYLFGDKGTYQITVSHVMRNGAGTAVARFGAEISKTPAEPDREVTEGRVSLELTEDGDFRHEFFEGSELFVNVLDGETVNFLPKFDIPESVACSLYRDGKYYPVPSSGILTEDGVYSAEFSCTDDEGNVEKRFMTFSIFMNPTKRLGIFQPPTDFEITSVKLNGNALAVENTNFFKLDGQGEYHIEYSNGEIFRTTELVRDTMPPVLYFNGTSEVVFKDRITVTSSEDCTYSIRQNGQLVGNSPELHGAGTYRVTATDSAGNVTEIRVEILPVSAINPFDFVIIFGVLILAAVIYFIIQKNTRIKVR